MHAKVVVKNPIQMGTIVSQTDQSFVSQIQLTCSPEKYIG